MSGGRRPAVPWIAGVAAALFALPGLRLPFLSDDWVLLAAVRDRLPCCSPLGDFRPLSLGLQWLDLRLFGLSPALFHATTVLLIGLACGLVARVVQRSTEDGRVALGAGLLFACHPYHVENAAWLPATHDVLMAVFFLLGLLAYDRWRQERRGLPFVAMACCEAALLAKEPALAFPLVLIAAGWVVPGRRPDGREWRRGFLPIAALTVLHFALVRPFFLGGLGRTLLGQGPGTMLRIAAAHAAASLFPLDPERLMADPFLCGSLAVLSGALFVLLARQGSGRFPRAAAGAMVLFTVCLLPDVVDLQKRYLFLPSAASCAALALLLRDAGRRRAALLGAALAAVWLPADWSAWQAWGLAGRTSQALRRDLSAVSADPAVREVVIANTPFRVRGASVAGDLTAMLELSGARSVPVHSVAWVSYESPWAAALLPAPPGEVRLRVPQHLYSRFVGPRPPPGERTVSTPFGDIEEEGGDRWLVRPAPAPGRVVLAWSENRLRAVHGE
jgi:hypothetical protein